MPVSAFLESLFGLEGNVALVTGATGGIGGALALGLARAGARVALNGRDPGRLAGIVGRIEAAGGIAASIPGEIGDPDACREIVERARSAFGGLDLLVNCAGMNRRRPIREVDPEIYERIMSVNLKAPYFMSQAAAPLLKERGGGAILHIGSLTTSIGLSTVSVYGMTKAALGQLAKTQAIEWAPDGIRVNCLCPGFIVTPLTEESVFGDERKRRWLMGRIPLARGGRPEEMVGMAIYLLSPAASYMTGQTVYLDGGLLAGSDWDREE